MLTNDHDFTSSATGTIIPHSLYDEVLNIGYIQLGLSHDTSAFVCDSVRHWWSTYGRVHYPHATSILLKCDGGGSNNARSFLFKQDLQALADELGIEIRVAHYPPYCSKYNPIEHRLFPHVTRACQGVIFTSVELVKELMEKTQTATGLKAFVHIIDKESVAELGVHRGVGQSEDRFLKRGGNFSTRELHLLTRSADHLTGLGHSGCPAPP